ncbi:MAG: adenine phosphoribosyltransferase [Pseudomonadota bacterium]
MNRTDFRALFGMRAPVVLPVIHVLDTPRSLQNIDVLRKEGAPGCFLINHDFGVEPFLPIVREVRAAHPDLWMGLNFLAVTGLHAFPQLAELERGGCRVDAYWADDARIDERSDAQSEARAIAEGRTGWSGLYFGGTAFKKQRPVAESDYGRAAKLACDWMDVVCTSGEATGVEAEDTKIATFRQAIGEKPLALASGITPENAHRYATVDAFMVATGINFDGNFYDIDRARLRRLLDVAEELGDKT